MDPLAALIRFLFELDIQAHPAPPLPDSFRQRIRQRAVCLSQRKNSANFLQPTAQYDKITEKDSSGHFHERKEHHD